MPFPIPETPFIRTLERVRRDGPHRWRDADGARLYEWDRTHGHFEVYNARGRHIAVADANGRVFGEAVVGRRIDV